MVYIFYKQEDQNELNQTVVPLLEERDYKLLSYPPKPDFNPEPESIFVAYLDDQLLREFLPMVADNNWDIGILPHPNVKHTIKGLGITGDLKQSITEIYNDENSHKLDLLCCNDVPVFQSVNIGEVFALKEENNKNRFLDEIWIFLKNLKKIPSLHHKAFTLSTDDEKIIYTSAIGIVVVEHPFSSIISKRLVTDSAMNDGIFNVLVVAPENILELLWFLWRSFLPKKNPISTFPPFIGQMKVCNFRIDNEREIEYTVDGEEKIATVMEFVIRQEALNLRQRSIYHTEQKGLPAKRSLKIERMPKGEKREELVKRKLPLFPRATTDKFAGLLKVLRENSKVRSTFLVMMILSTLIATCGLFLNSSPVIIGAMILAPIISPIVSFSMGMVRYDPNLLRTGIKTILIGTLAALAVASSVSLLIPLKIVTPEISARLTPNLLDLAIAIASGIAAAYAHSKEEIAKSLAGVAIAVALVPPLAVAGIGIGWWNWDVFAGAFLLYLTNLAGIVMFAGLSFLFLGFAPFQRAKLGLLYTFIAIALVTIPLTLTFQKIRQESTIVNVLEGVTVNKVVLKDVNVQLGSPLQISLRLVSGKALGEEEIKGIKKIIETRVKQPVELEIITAIKI